MILEIQAKTLLATIRGDDPLFGLKYNLNLYRGCQHQCIYCDSRSLCYGIENFGDVLVKVNAIELLERDLARKRVKGVIGFGSMSDPYTPVERQYNLTGRALAVIARHGFPVHLMTKSDLVLKDMEVLAEIARVQARVCFSITCADDGLAARIEPGAPPSSQRWAAMAALAGRGILCGVALMPMLPYISDSVENIEAIVERTAASGGSFILPWFSMTLRDRQRDYYYASLDRLFPGLRTRYQRRFGGRYECVPENAPALYQAFARACERHGIQTHVPAYNSPDIPRQLALI